VIVMSARKLSELPAAGPVAAGDLVPLVQAGETRRTSVGDLRAGLLPTTGGTVTGPLSLQQPLAIAAGSAAAPAIAFTVDGDTGLFRAAGDTLGLCSGGHSRVEVRPGGMTLRADSQALANQPFGDWQSNGQLLITGAGNTGKRLALGVDTVAAPMLSVIQSMESGVATRALVLNPSGGAVGVGTGVAQPTHPLTVNGIVAPATNGIHDLGAPAARWNDIHAVNASIQTSDARDKTEVEECALGLGFVCALRPVTFRWTDEVRPAVTRTVQVRRPRMELVAVERQEVREVEGLHRLVTLTETVQRPAMRTVPLHAADGTPLLDEEGNPLLHRIPILDTVDEEQMLEPAVDRRHHRRHTGLIAQEVKEVLDRLGIDAALFVHDAGTDRMGLRYAELIAPLIRAVQELATRLDRLEMAGS